MTRRAAGSRCQKGKIMEYNDELETLEYYLYMTAREAEQGKPNVEGNPFSSVEEPPQTESEDRIWYYPRI